MYLLRNRFSRSQGIITNGLWMNFDFSNPSCYPGTGTTANDLSSSGFVATLYNGVSFSSSNGGILVFDGSNDYLQVNTIGLGASGQSFSVGGWVKARNFLTASNNFVYTNYPLGGQQGFWAIAFNGSGASNFFWLRDTNAQNSTQSTAASWTTNAWYYVYGVRNAGSSTMSFYQNGSLIGTSSFPSNVSVVTEGKLLTISQHASGQYLAVDIGSFEKYNRALSTSEIAENFNRTKARFGL